MAITFRWSRFCLAHTSRYLANGPGTPEPTSGSPRCRRHGEENRTWLGPEILAQLPGGVGVQLIEGIADGFVPGIFARHGHIVDEIVAVTATRRSPRCVAWPASSGCLLAPVPARFFSPPASCGRGTRACGTSSRSSATRGRSTSTTTSSAPDQASMHRHAGFAAVRARVRTRQAAHGSPVGFSADVVSARHLLWRRSAQTLTNSDLERRLVGCGETQYGASHCGRRADPGLERPQPDGEAGLIVIAGEIDVADYRDHPRPDDLQPQIGHPGDLRRVQQGPDGSRPNARVRLLADQEPPVDVDQDDRGDSEQHADHD